MQWSLDPSDYAASSKPGADTDTGPDTGPNTDAISKFRLLLVGRT